jgi:uroporphyrinogen decarboxylase
MRSVFLDACLRKDVEYTPVWFMRQAGRYLPSYRKIKGSKTVVEIAKNPELASNVAVDAVRTLKVDAGIIFADIMLPLEGIGVKFGIVENTGPIVKKPIRSIDDIDSLDDFNAESVRFVFDGIKATLEKLDDSVPLIGFSGAPFTLAGYLIEGQPSKDFTLTKKFMYSYPEGWHLLMKKLTAMVMDYLRGQIKHGVSAVQLFDSWVGCLSQKDYDHFVLNYTKEILGSINSGVPKIHFCADSSALIESFDQTNPDVISVDWRIRIDEVWKRCRREVAVQGNLDPALALVGGRIMERRVYEILEKARGNKGYIFSLGHGVLKGTPPANLRRIVQIVHEKTRRRA